MTDTELLIAISDMMDQKLDTRLKPIENDIKSMKDDIKILKTDVAGLKNNVTILNDEVTVLKTGMLDIKLFQENSIMPRLNTIESCYTDTYIRYKNYNDKMQTAFDDIELLKKVVAEHSEQLKNLA